MNIMTNIDLCLSKLLSFGDLNPDWDSYGSDIIRDDSLRQAYALLQRMKHEFDGLVLEVIIYVIPLSKGIVQVEVYNKSASLEIEVYPDKFDYLLVTKDEAYVESSFASIDDVLNLVKKVILADVSGYRQWSFLASRFYPEKDSFIVPARFVIRNAYEPKEEFVWTQEDYNLDKVLECFYKDD